MHFENIQENVKAIQHVGFRGPLAQNPEFAYDPNLMHAMLYEFANLFHELQAPSTTELYFIIEWLMKATNGVLAISKG